MKYLILLNLAAGFAAAQTSVTYHRDVADMLQERCQSCHRPGEIGPMPLRSYSEVRPWAKSIQQAVVSRKMPPWNADRTVGKFHNDPSLSQQEIDTLTAWVKAGAPEGNPKDAPKPVQFVDGWNIGTPDQVFEMPKAFLVPAAGTVEYTYVIIPTNFTEDRWVSAAEYRPGNASVVHHATVYVREPKSQWLRSYPVGEFFVPAEQIRTAKTGRPSATTNAGASALEQPIAGHVPGRPAKRLPEGYGLLIPAGSDLVIQLHYTANGKATADRSSVGFTFSKSKPAKRVLRVNAADDSFVIPPGAADYPVSGKRVLNVDAELLEVYPHMHLRGKSMALSATYPTGESEKILWVPAYDFNWQLVYALDRPKVFPKGTVMHAQATFDNSANNRYNPDPKAEVRWGDQSWEEMMVGFFTIAVAPETDLRTLYMSR
jgi:mono/diheme cytochrome c family protein